MINHDNLVVVSHIFDFHPFPGFHDPIWLSHIFQMGWFNRQVDKDWSLLTWEQGLPFWTTKKVHLSTSKSLTALTGGWKDGSLMVKFVMEPSPL